MTARRGIGIAGFCLGACLVAVSPARAQTDETSKAKTLFDIGAQAYDAGNFPAALQAFDEAYRLAPRPGIMFSMAQAHRRQYYLDKKPEHLRAAVRFYREYVGRVEQGGRRAEAAQALAELEPMAERLEKGSDASKPAPAAKAQTLLMVSTKTKGALVTVDGAKPVPAPLFAELKPGKHTLRVTADGFAPDDREVEVREGIVVPLDVPLRELPGHLRLVGVGGGQVTIDGRPYGTAPLPGPIEVPPGRHLVTLARNGYEGYSREVDVRRGEAKTLDVKLGVTRQRVASYVLIGVGAAGLAIGGGFATAAALEQKKASNVEAKVAAGGLPSAQLQAYADAKSARDQDRFVAGVVVGGGAAVVLTGLLMFAFDTPTIQASGPRSDDAPRGPSGDDGAPPRALDEGTMEISTAPLLGPGIAGAAFSGRF